MKHSVIIFLILIMGASASTSYAEEKNIEAIEKHWLEDTRSASCIPTITHDGNTLYIYSDIVLDDLHIIIKDTTGTILYSSTVTISNTQRYSFTIDNMNVGEFLIELTHENKYLYGYFNICLLYTSRCV